MTLDSYYYPSLDYSMIGAIPPATAATSTGFELPYSSIFDSEEDEQLLLDLQSFLSPVSSDTHHDYPVPHHIESALPPASEFQLDFDYTTLFPLLPLVQEQFPSLDPLTEQGDYYLTEPAPKRQKCFDSSPYNYYSTGIPAPAPKRQKCFDSSPYNYYSTGFPAPAPQEIFPAEKLCTCCTRNAFNGGMFESSECSSYGKRRESGARATAQSVAARDRRKKISDKTQELGKLVPGAASSKMNTAEMLQHAFKYVKFLQAQVSLLQLMGSESSSQEGKDEMINAENLKILASSAVQEKLYMKDKCLVPLEFIEQLAENGDVQKDGLISKDLEQLVQSVSAENC